MWQGLYLPLLCFRFLCRHI
ncbi:MAG: hypothetical protein IK100_03010 [Muribaculaceae bacterium]|nr:hypothetical protein [Muribaculaceae bacterium]MBR5117602.1 hypothetical protein [Muribaculaceae bacterium]